MPKSSNQKLKLIYLMKILLERTDETHGITMSEIIDALAAYARKMFGMYGGKEKWVRMECDNSFAGVMIDRFGKDVSMIRPDDKRFVVNVEVAVSRQFLAWVIGLGAGVTIAGPDSVVEMMQEEIDRLIRQYRK